MHFTGTANDRCKYFIQKLSHKIRSIAKQTKISSQLLAISFKLKNKGQEIFKKLPYHTEILDVVKQLTPEQKKFAKAIYLNIACMVLIAVISASPANKMITPWVNSMQMMPEIDQSTIPHKTFAFAPGWSLAKIDKVDVDGLSTLAFYDIPVNADGTLNFNNSGYATFTSAPASDLFERAHQKGVKVVVTLSQNDNDSILQILDDSDAQSNMISQAVDTVKNAQIDGVNIDFEYQGNPSTQYRSKLNSFVKNLTDTMHSQIPGSLVTVSLSNSLIAESLYDPSTLSKTADQTLLMDYDFAVTESNDGKASAPVFGGSQTQYWKQASGSINNMLRYVPNSKLAVETAWYGNGNDYPLYVPSSTPQSTDDTAIRYATPLHTPLSQDMINSLVASVPASAQDAARSNLPYIAKALEDEGILNENVLAYALATIEHETDGTFEPISEYGGVKSARRLGYEGGTDYYGRGFIQLTHLRNYKVIGERIGMGDQLAEHPELASQPQVAAKVLAAFFKDNNIANLASAGDFVGARIPVNPDYNGYSIALKARKYLYSMS